MADYEEVHSMDIILEVAFEIAVNSILWTSTG